MKPRTSASSGGLVRSGRGSRSRHSVKGMEASSGSTQQTWSTCASVNPRRSRAAVTGNRKLEATRLRQTCSPDRLTPRQASSTTSAQAKAAVPSTNVDGADRVAERLLQVAGRAAARTPPPRPPRRPTTRTRPAASAAPWCAAGRARALGSSETSIVLQPRTVTMPSRVCSADRGRRDADVVGVDHPGDDHPEDQPEHRGQHLRGEQGPERRPDAAGDGLGRGPVRSSGVAVGLGHHTPPPTAGGGSTEWSSRPCQAAHTASPTVNATMSTIGTPQAQLLARPKPSGSGRELSWIST